jgi:ankyrin repeat protein
MLTLQLEQKGDVVELLLAHGTAIESPDGIRFSPLICAAVGVHPHTIRLLLAHHANVNAAADLQLTPLIVAAGSSNAESVLVLLARARYPLVEVNYNKGRFEPHVLKCRAKPKEYLLDDTAVSECLTVYGSKHKKPVLTPKTQSLASVAALKEKVISVRARTVTANEPISRLKDIPEVENWVNEGQPLHERKDTCQFCGQM